MALVGTPHIVSQIVGCLAACLRRLYLWLVIRRPSSYRRARLSSLLRQGFPLRHSNKCSFEDRKYSSLKQLVISGRFLMQSSPNRHSSARWERRQLKDWASFALSLTKEAVWPSETSALLQTAQQSYDGLRVFDREVRCLHTRLEDESVTIQVSCIATNASRCVGNIKFTSICG
jgi:hypothetical protein